MKSKIFGIPVLIIVAGVAAFIFRKKIKQLLTKNQAIPMTPTE